MNKLFNEPHDGAVLAHDIFGNKVTVPIRELKLRVSIYGILKENNKVLMQKHPKYKIWSLPGGGIELGELLNEALVREFEEETGLKVKVKRLLEVVEDFFAHEGFKTHSILIFYEVEKISGNLLTKSNNDDSESTAFYSKEDLAGIKLPEQILKVLINYL